MVFGPENGEQETEEKHHQAKANQADDYEDTNILVKESAAAIQQV